MKSVNNIKELAALLNLSVSTVSRVLNGKGKSFRISEETSKRVFDAAKEFNYSPNRVARGLKLEKTDTIGLIIPDIANPFFASIAKIIELQTRKNGFSILLCDSLDDEKTEFELLQLMAHRKVDGIIIAPVGFQAEQIQEIRKKGIPVVVTDRYFPNDNIPYIATDNYCGAFMAAEYLIENGHTTIACIQGIQSTSPNTQRVKGYKDALRKHGITPDPELIVGYDFGEENGYLQTQKVLSNKKKPTAIFALSNLITLGVLRALTEKGLSIPDDMSIISFDEQPYSAYLATPMTTIKQKREEIATRAVTTLLSMISDGNIENKTKILIEPELIIRKSVKKLT